MSVLQDWALGVLHAKIIAAITLMGPQWWLKTVIEQVRNSWFLVSCDQYHKKMICIGIGMNYNKPVMNCSCCRCTLMVSETSTSILLCEAWLPQSSASCCCLSVCPTPSLKALHPCSASLSVWLCVWVGYGFLVS